MTPEPIMTDVSDRRGSSNTESRVMRDCWADPEFRKTQSEAIKRGQSAARLKKQHRENEIKAASDAVQPYRKQVSEAPALLSLLYDIDLLPEQINTTVNAARMIAVCEMFKRLTPEDIAGLFEERSPS